MKKFFALCILASAFCSYAQPSAHPEKSTSLTTSLIEKPGNITGTVTDKVLLEPLPYVTIVVQNPAGDIITGGITDDNGNFNIMEIPLGKFVVKIQYIGYKTSIREIEITAANANVDVGIVALEEDIASLDEVTVVAERSTIVQKIDRRVINVGRDLTTMGASASELMNNIPSVNVDQDGNIALRGNTNVRILVDGKPTNIDAAQLLRQIPSTSIKQIELITNPSAKYNPEGMSGIINIILHKNTNDGFNGDIALGLTVGENARFNSSINLNYRSGKFNFYGNYGARAGKSFNEGLVNRFDNPSTPGLDESSLESFDILNNNRSHLFKFGVDYFINDKNSLSVYSTQNIYNSKSTALTRVEFFDTENTIINQAANLKSQNDNASYNLAFKHKFDEDGHELGVEADYNTFEGDENSQFLFENNSAVNYFDFILNDRSNTTLNLDYTNPLTEDIKIELGAEARIQKTENNYTTTNDELDNAGFFYNRDIFSGYATYGHKVDKWSYQLGARVESYIVDAGFKAEGEEEVPFEENIFTVYPSAFVNYAYTEKSTFQLSYSRRVDRPGLQQINPIREFNTPQLTSRGNQQLNPQFTNSLEFNYTRQLEKGSITGGVFYRMIKDEINRSISIDPLDPTRVILSYENFEDNNAYGFEVSGSYRPTKWWNLNSSFDLYNQIIKGVLGTENVEIQNTAYTFRMNHSFKATKDLTFQLFALYRGPMNTLQFEIEPFYFINTGFRYNVMQGKATISFNYNDIFDTQRAVVAAGQPIPMTGEFNWESKTWHVGLSYRFGGANNKALTRKQRDARETSGEGMF